ncbi:hypothetical protein [Bradyrhizobium sp. 6(2017)]|uniref:hypothetical protein n=1 Tax=Bradyrhizobium sp. 6(2017) TaxID=1197460 RepID=UPI00048DE70C|nr:hypothetical protein [Bradyrhizobium sp. 6(2017)]QIG98297.1 hypothetical protein G6P99_43025 [Bradyrhizobium sp. 6(2017)]
MPRGEEDEIPERANPLLFFFFAPAAARAFLGFATSDPSLFRQYDRRSGGDSALVAYRHGNETGTDFQIAGQIARNAGDAPVWKELNFFIKSMIRLLAGAGGIEPPNSGSKISLIMQRNQGALRKNTKMRSSNFNSLVLVSK